MSIRSKTLLVGVTSALLLGGMALTTKESGAATIVQVGESSINPDTLTIERGEEVIWTAARAAGPPHFQWTPTSKGVRVTVTEDGDFAATLVTPGEYRYVIAIGKGGRVDLELPGKIIVK